MPSRVVCRQNPANPDAKKTIVWGDQSWEEMFYTAIRYRWLDETSTKQVEYDNLIDQTRLMGMFDDNMDGKLQLTELRGKQGDWLKGNLAALEQAVAA